MFSRYGYRTVQTVSFHQKFLSTNLNFNVSKYNSVYSRLLSSSGQNQPPKPPAITQSTAISNKKKLQQMNDLQNKIMAANQKEKVGKANKPELDQYKRLGWLLSGSAIAFITALYGKMYMLFAAVPLFIYHSKDIDVMSRTFTRDILFLWRSSKCWVLSKQIQNRNLTLPKIFEYTAKKYPDKIMLQMHDQNWKYKDVVCYANRTSRLMQKYGFKKGDIISMFALNSPEMIAIVLGLAKIGVITTLINTDLRSKGLTRAIRNSGCKAVIFDDDLMHAFEDVYKDLHGIKVFQTRHKAKHPNFHVLEEELIREYNDPPEIYIKIHHNDPLLFMYSSEDTQFREPIVITHSKFLYNSFATTLMLDLQPSEKIYNPTPLHEPTGMIMGIGPSITNAVPTVLRPKFSATHYFKECYVYNCTVGLYTGNMCKHLLLSPVSPIETFHPVKVMYGNGLESDYWQEFVNRFRTKMYEVHDTSEENINLINMEGKIGVVGFRPKLLPSALFPHYVIRVFGEEKIPIRDSQGLCQLCNYGEPGMLVRVWDSKKPIPPKMKTIANVFKNGDIAITNGTILTLDENQYLRPMRKYNDKTWLNKLVTTEEVEFIASRLTSKRCAAFTLNLGNAQNVEVLAIEDPNKQLNMKKFTDDLIDHLPKDWVPHYIRIVPKFEILKNNEVNKKPLILQGLNIESNLVYHFDKKTMSYNHLIWTNQTRPQVIESLTKVKNTTLKIPLLEQTQAMENSQDLLKRQITHFIEEYKAKQLKENVKSTLAQPRDSVSKMILDSNVRPKQAENLILRSNIKPLKHHKVKDSVVKKSPSAVKLETRKIVKPVLNKSTENATIPKNIERPVIVTRHPVILPSSSKIEASLKVHLQPKEQPTQKRKELPPQQPKEFKKPKEQPNQQSKEPGQKFKGPEAQQIKDPLAQQIRDQIAQQVKEQPAQQVKEPPVRQFKGPETQQVRDPLAQQIRDQIAQQVKEQPAQQFKGPEAQPFRDQFAQQVKEQPAQPFKDQLTPQVKKQPAQQFKEQEAQQFIDQLTQQVKEQPAQQFKGQETHPFKDQLAQQIRDQLAQQVKEQPAQPFKEQEAHPFRDQLAQQITDQLAQQVKKQPPQQPTEELPQQYKEQAIKLLKSLASSQAANIIIQNTLNKPIIEQQIKEMRQVNETATTEPEKVATETPKLEKDPLEKDLKEKKVPSKPIPALHETKCIVAPIQVEKIARPTNMVPPSPKIEPIPKPIDKDTKEHVKEPPKIEKTEEQKDKENKSKSEQTIMFIDKNNSDNNKVTSETVHLKANNSHSEEKK